MKIAVVTSDGHEHRYVLDRLNAALGNHIALVVIEKWPKRKTGFASFKAQFKRYTAAQVAERIVTKLGRKLLRHPQRLSAGVTEVLGPLRALPAALDYFETPSANRPECVARLRALAPDYILIYGTGIIRQGVIESSLRATLNLHTGISPHYRGSDCEFWPLYRGEPGMVGATVHECTAAVDGGAIYTTRAANMTGSDTVFTAFGKSVQVGAEIYADIAARLAAGECLEPMPQNFSIGREYRFKDRTLIQDLMMEIRTATGSLGRAIAAAGR
jgi:methionyl-tRNA formyltransferase